MLKKIALVTVVILAVLFGGALLTYANLEDYAPSNLVPPASAWVDESKPLREQTARVELDGRVFNIPQMYIESKMPLSGVFKDSILLEVIWPEMGSIYELKDRAEYDEVTKKERRLGWILLEPSRIRPSLDQQVSNMQESMTKIDQAESTGTLEKYLWYRGIEKAPELRHEVYLERDERGSIINYIDCSRGPSSLFPVCSHKFIQDDLLYDISYNEAAFLTQWQAQRQRAIDFIHSFELHSNSEP